MQLSESELGLIKEVFSKYKEKRPQIFLFGSRALNSAREYSDIDLLIKSESKFSSTEKSLIKDSFEESNSPFIYDLVFDEDLYGPYRDDIEKHKIKVI